MAQINHDLTLSQRGADAVLAEQGTTLREFLQAAKDRGLSYEQISRDLYIKTDGKVEITGTTVGRWLDELGIKPTDPVAVGE